MPERHRILIVDDNAQDRQVVVQALRRETAEIDGIEADVLEIVISVFSELAIQPPFRMSSGRASRIG